MIRLIAIPLILVSACGWECDLDARGGPYRARYFEQPRYEGDPPRCGPVDDQAVDAIDSVPDVGGCVLLSRSTPSECVVEVEWACDVIVSAGANQFTYNQHAWIRSVQVNADASQLRATATIEWTSTPGAGGPVICRSDYRLELTH